MSHQLPKFLTDQLAVLNMSILYYSSQYVLQTFKIGNTCPYRILKNKSSPNVTLFIDTVFSACFSLLRSSC